MFRTIRLTVSVLVAVSFPSMLEGVAFPSEQAPGPGPSQQEYASTYVLGPDDQISIRVLEADEIGGTAIRIESSGEITLPYIGRVRAAGLTVKQLQRELIERLKAYIQQPDVTVAITEFRSQPVSVVGAVRNPGVHQLQGRKMLLEILSLAGGLDQTAGPNIKVTRSLKWGRIPLKSAADDPTGQFSIAQVGVKAILAAESPEQNIPICPYDVISVPRAEMVYVSGQVMRAGAFPLNERESMSVLQAITLAGGMDRYASPKHARILRRPPTGEDRLEIAVNLQKILEAKSSDVPLLPDDILFVPNSSPKRAAIRAVEAAIQAGTGMVVWRR